MIENQLIAVTKPEIHAKVHKSKKSAIFASSLVNLMKQEVVKNPTVPIGMSTLLKLITI